MIPTPTPDLLRNYLAACGELERLSKLHRANKLKSTADFRNYQAAIARREKALRDLYPTKKVA